MCLSMWGSFCWVVPIVIITIIIVLFLEDKSYRISLLWRMLCIWGIALIYLLFIYRLPGGKDAGFSFDLFHMYRRAGFMSWEAIQTLRQILFNILLYIPFGCVLLSLTGKTRLTFFIGTSFSIITELLQGLTRLGWTDVDDVISNTFGLLMGVFLFKIFRFIIWHRNGEQL